MEISIKVDTYERIHCCDSCGVKTEKIGEQLVTQNDKNMNKKLMYLYKCKKCNHEYCLYESYPIITYIPLKKEK